MKKNNAPTREHCTNVKIRFELCTKRHGMCQYKYANECVPIFACTVIKAIILGTVCSTFLHFLFKFFLPRSLYPLFTLLLFWFHFNMYYYVVCFVVWLIFQEFSTFFVGLQRKSNYTLTLSDLGFLSSTTGWRVNTQ